MCLECSASESYVFTGSGITAACYLSSKIPKEIESMQEVVKELRSERVNTPFIYLSSQQHTHMTTSFLNNVLMI